MMDEPQSFFFTNAREQRLDKLMKIHLGGGVFATDYFPEVRPLVFWSQPIIEF